MTTQYLVTVVENGRTTQHWFAPSESLRTSEDSDSDAALLAAQEWHWGAQEVRLAMSAGQFVTRSK